MSCKYCNSCSNVGNRNLIDIDLNLGVLGMSKLCGHISKYTDGSFIDLSFEPLGLPVTQIQRVQPISYCFNCGRCLNKEGKADEGTGNINTKANRQGIGRD